MGSGLDAPVRPSFGAPSHLVEAGRWLALVLLIGGCVSTRPVVRPQNPSPMVEHTRAHERLGQRVVPGRRTAMTFDQVSVPVLVRCEAPSSDPPLLLIHLHGAGGPAEQAVEALGRTSVVASFQLGSGSGVYERFFQSPGRFGAVTDSLRAQLADACGAAAARPLTVITAFSAGYGGVRAMLRQGADLDAVVLLDALHTDYVPVGRPLYEGGRLEEANLAPFVAYGAEAVEGRRRLLFTHSEVFPGTFASTTETADYLVDRLGLERKALLDWGPGGMQLLSEASRGGLRILGFAGNSAPDHVDHLHGLPVFLRVLLDDVPLREAQGETRPIESGN